MARPIEGDTPLANRLRELDVSLVELAGATGLSETTCRYLARGPHHPTVRSRGVQWTVRNLALISKALGVTPMYLAPERFTT